LRFSPAFFYTGATNHKYRPMAEISFDQEFVEYVVKSIVEHPDDVTTERSVDDIGTLISLRVNAEDMATIIGKDGRTAKALRTVLRVLGARHSQHVTLKIVEPEGGRGFLVQEDERAMGHSNAVREALSDVPQDEIA
jgi:uncharacterized protein